MEINYQLNKPKETNQMENALMWMLRHPKECCYIQKTKEPHIYNPDKGRIEWWHSFQERWHEDDWMKPHNYLDQVAEPCDDPSIPKPAMKEVNLEEAMKWSRRNNYAVFKRVDGTEFRYSEVGIRLVSNGFDVYATMDVVSATYLIPEEK